MKPGPKPRKVSDGKGLYVLVQPTGSLLWRFKYRLGGTEKLISLGGYPQVPLALARERRDEARRQVAQGIDPSAARKAEQSAGRDTFGAIAREWLARQSSTWVPGHLARVRGRLEADVLPCLETRPVADLTASEILETVRRVADRGALETAHRELWSIGAIMRYAVATGRAAADPTPALRGALPAVRSKHFAAITDPAAVGELLRAIEGYQGTHVVRSALRLAPRAFVRPGELRRAEWAEIDADSALWTIPGSKMKTGHDHIVPLSRQALEILRDLEPLTGRGRYCFPSPRTTDRPMSENAITAALRRMGYQGDDMTGHGFRAIARTLLDEQLGQPAHLIEHQLAHAVRDPLGRSYNRTQHLKERRVMMQRWSDYLDTLRDGAQVVPLERRHG
jgi:integrase